MKLNASAQNAFSFAPALPFVGQWEKGAAKRARQTQTIRPFDIANTAGTLSQRDELARKQEMICAVILGLCLLFSVAVCFCQLARVS